MILQEVWRRLIQAQLSGVLRIVPEGLLLKLVMTNILQLHNKYKVAYFVLFVRLSEKYKTNEIQQ